MTGLHISTVAWSAHEAITACDRPLSAEQVTVYLQRVWDPRVDRVEIEDAVQQALARGCLRVVAANDDVELYDTNFRNADGKRCPPPGRLRDVEPSNPNFGWF